MSEVLTFWFATPGMTQTGRSYSLTKGLTGLNQTSASSSKADVQNVRIGVELNVCLWPKADVR